MALARNTIIRPIEMNLPVLQVPSELMFSQITGYQAEKDMYDAMSATVPKSRTVDEPWRQEYQKYVQDLSENVSQAFASGNVDYAMKALRKAKTNVADLWKPGGLANALEEAAMTEASEIAKLQEAHKDDPTGAGNQLWAIKRFKQGQQALNYDYDTGKYNRVGQAEMYNYVDKEKILLDLAKAADPDMTEEDIISGNWIVRLKEKGVSEDRIQGLFQSFMSRPEVQSQLEIDFFNQYGVDFNDLDVDFSKLDWNNLTPEDSAKLEFITATQKDVLSSVATTKSTYNKLSDEEKQKYLKQLGYYKGSIDGSFGKLSKEAEQRYLDNLQKQADQDISTLQTSPKSYFIKEVAAEPSRKLFYNLFGKEYSRTLTANPFALENVKFQHKLKLQSSLFNMQNQYNQETYNNAVVTPSKATSFNTTLQGLREDANTMVKNGQNMLAGLVKQPGMQAVFGFVPKGGDTPNVMAQLIKVYEETKTAPDPVAAFQNKVDELGYTARFGTDPQSLHRAISANANDIKNALSLIEDGRTEVEHLGHLETAVIVETGVADRWFNNFKSQLPAGVTKQKFVEMVNKASTMTEAEIAADPQLKIFTRPPYGPVVKDSHGNMAVDIKKYMMDDATTHINEKGLPQSALTFSLSSADARAAIGKANKELTSAFLSNKHGFADAMTQNNTKWTSIDGGSPKNVADINMEDAKVVLTSTFGKPVLQLTTKKDGIFHLEVPKTGNARKVVNSAIQEEMAIALNNGAEDDLMLFSSIARQLKMTPADLGYSIIEVNNHNGKDPEVHTVATADGTPLPSTYAPVKTVSLADRMGNDYNFDIITWGSENLQKWGVVKDGLLLGPIQIANTQDGVGVAFDNSRSISESAYSSYNDALNALEAVNQGMNIPVEQIMQKLPKGTPNEFGNTQQFQMESGASISGSRSLVEELLGLEEE